jgi:hypothetical protein
MLQVAATRRAPRFGHRPAYAPVVVGDGAQRVATGERMQYFADPDLLPVMDRKNAHADQSDRWQRRLEETIRRSTSAPGRFLTLTEPSYGDGRSALSQSGRCDRRARQAASRFRCQELGLYLREHRSGPGRDRRPPLRSDVGVRGQQPAGIHPSDPEAFFWADRNSERYEELNWHPDWSFHGRDFPGNAELLEARDRVIARHPRTTFVLLHVSNAENLAGVSACLDRYPNTYVDIAARINELGRQPRTARRFFERYQDRIFFGTDAIPPPAGNETPQQVFGDALYEIYYRFLETEDEYFDYAPHPRRRKG